MPLLVTNWSDSTPKLAARAWASVTSSRSGSRTQSCATLTVWPP
jgi:hypothetical protein